MSNYRYLISVPHELCPNCARGPAAPQAAETDYLPSYPYCKNCPYLFLHLLLKAREFLLQPLDPPEVLAYYHHAFHALSFHLQW